MLTPYFVAGLKEEVREEFCQALVSLGQDAEPQVRTAALPGMVVPA